MVARKRRGVPHGNSNARPCAVCLNGDLSVLDEKIELSALFPAIRFPAFYKCRREIFRSRRYPGIDDSGRKESTSLYFASVGSGDAAEFSSIEPDKLLVSAC